MTLLRQDWHTGQPGDSHFHRHPIVPPEPVRLPPLTSLISRPSGITTTSGPPQATSPLGPPHIYQDPQASVNNPQRQGPIPFRTKRPHHESASLISPRSPPANGLPCPSGDYGPESPTFFPASSSNQRSMMEDVRPRHYARPQNSRKWHEDPQVSSVYAQQDDFPRKVAIPFTPEALRCYPGQMKAQSPSGSVGTAVEASPLRSEPVSASTMPDPWPQWQGQIEHTLFVRQQPRAARACGAGDRDRRVIDPPPILQLNIGGPSLPEDERRARMRNPWFVVNCTIYDKTGTQDVSVMTEDYCQHRRLVGNAATNPFVGEDEDGQLGCFFPFPDLSVRTVGEYRLKFTMVCLEPAEAAKPGKSYAIRCSTLTDVFTVYSAKDFPGMSASTPLTRRLKDQGCVVSIKKGKDGRGKGKYLSDGSDDDDDVGNRATLRKRSRVQ